MIRVYRPEVREGVQWVLAEEEGADYELVQELGTPLARDWVPLQVELVKEKDDGGKRERVDMPWMTGMALVMRPRAVSVLGELCLRVGELLPLACGGEELVLWNVTRTVDALDWNASEVVLGADGKYVIDVRSHAFKRDVVAGLPAFRIPETKAIFVGAEFVELVGKAELTGPRFELAWAG